MHATILRSRADPFPGVLSVAAFAVWRIITERLAPPTVDALPVSTKGDVPDAR